ILPLMPGERLSREEFESRYQALPQIKKAELLEGVVFMPSPVHFHAHGRPSRHLSGWIAVYESQTPGVMGGDNSTSRVDLGNEPQPDLLLLIDPACGGRARFSSDDYVEGEPEMVAEVSAGTADFDLTAKLEIYQRNGVQEYLVWRVLDQAVDWFALRDDRYVRLQADSAGIVRSEVFPGLWLDPRALIRKDLAAVLAVLQRGLVTTEHSKFVARLGAASTP